MRELFVCFEGRCPVSVQVILKDSAQQEALFEGVVQARSTMEAVRLVLALPRVQEHLKGLAQRTLCCSAKEVLS